jgi:hypothetical protein
MTTVQVAVCDVQLAHRLESLLFQCGRHIVRVVRQPDFSLDGVIVIDSKMLDNPLYFAEQPDRFVVITPNDQAVLAKIWEAGVPHVVFEDDSAKTAELAVSAAEIRLSNRTPRA